MKKITKPNFSGFALGSLIGGLMVIVIVLPCHTENHKKRMAHLAEMQADVDALGVRVHAECGVNYREAHGDLDYYHSLFAEALVACETIDAPLCPIKPEKKPI